MIEVLKYLPQRYPMLMIDAIGEVDLANKKITCIKNVSFNEPWCQGHFTNHPIFPASLLFEAVGQAAIILAYKLLDLEHSPENEIYGASCKDYKCIKPVFPGDQIHAEAKITAFVQSLNLVEYSSVARVNGQVVASISRAIFYLKIK